LLLIDAGILPATATLDADLLARHVLGWDLATWLTHRSDVAAPDFVDRYQRIVARRARREPVAYIRGVQEFWGREFVVNAAVLIPRPETELLIELALPYLATHPKSVIADVGTGSGCLAVTLALECPGCVVHAIDISADALTVARGNAARWGVTDRVHFVHGSVLAGLSTPLDVIVANPPYVAERDAPGLSPEVREYEPSVALFGGNDGWREIRELLRQAATALRPGGVLVMELGYGQSEELDEKVSAVAGLRLKQINTDLQGIPRAATVERSVVSATG
jgi:release factor glutamine methyltransferase